MGVSAAGSSPSVFTTTRLNLNAQTNRSAPDFLRAAEEQLLSDAPSAENSATSFAGARASRTGEANGTDGTTAPNAAVQQQPQQQQPSAAQNKTKLPITAQDATGFLKDLLDEAAKHATTQEQLKNIQAAAGSLQVTDGVLRYLFTQKLAQKYPELRNAGANGADLASLFSEVGTIVATLKADPKLAKATDVASTTFNTLSQVMRNNTFAQAAGKDINQAGDLSATEANKLTIASGVLKVVATITKDPNIAKAANVASTSVSTLTQVMRNNAAQAAGKEIIQGSKITASAANGLNIASGALSAAAIVTGDPNISKAAGAVNVVSQGATALSMTGLAGAASGAGAIAAAVSLFSNDPGTKNAAEWVGTVATAIANPALGVPLLAVKVLGELGVFGERQGAAGDHAQDMYFQDKGGVHKITRSNDNTVRVWDAIENPVAVDFDSITQQPQQQKESTTGGLVEGQVLMSKDGTKAATVNQGSLEVYDIQADGNAQLIFSTQSTLQGTVASAGAVKIEDGNLKMYREAAKGAPGFVPTWESKTGAPGKFQDAVLTMQDDGNLVISDGKTGEIAWNSKSSPPGESIMPEFKEMGSFDFGGKFDRPATQREDGTIAYGQYNELQLKDLNDDGLIDFTFDHDGKESDHARYVARGDGTYGMEVDPQTQALSDELDKVIEDLKTKNGGQVSDENSLIPGMGPVNPLKMVGPHVNSTGDAEMDKMVLKNAMDQARKLETGAASQEASALLRAT
jgi:L-lactate utilization protein LutC